MESMKNRGTIEVDMFSDEVDSTDHPEAATFKLLLEQVADQYECRLMTFDVSGGTVSFSFDSDELMAKILTILKNDNQS